MLANLSSPRSRRLNFHATVTSLAVLTFFIFCSSANAQTATTTTLSITPSSVTEGQSVTLSAAVVPSSGATPAGKVNFYYGSTLLASGNLNGSGFALIALSSANVTPGAYSVVAKYAGNSSDSPSTSPPVTATILAETTTTLSSASPAYVLGQSATLTALVASRVSGSLTGSVRFYYDGTLLGSAPVNAGFATFKTIVPTDYEPGTYRVTGKYSGNALYAASSGVFTVTLDRHFSITPGGVGVAPSAATQLSLSPNPGGDETWFVNGIAGGNSSVGTISASGLYTAPNAASAVIAHITAASTTQPGYITPSIPIYVVPAGVLAPTANGQVASYTINLPAGSSVSAQFGTTTSYGLNTWSLSAPSGGGSITLLIAGMMNTTLYHVQGLISLPGGITFTDKDNQFTTTKSLGYPGALNVTTNPDLTPQAGVEFIDRENSGAYISDLDGNYLWGYPLVNTTPLDYTHPFKLLSNGHLLIELAPDSEDALQGVPISTGTSFDVREVDYTNTIFRDLTMATVQANLNASGYVNNNGQQITLSDIHHDVTVNPTTGHWLLIANIFEPITGLTGYPKGVDVLGDVIIDVDPNNDYAVDWIWNEFDHLDITRQPMGFPDWTHTNAIVYAKDDHNILISIRHQNWVLKLNYDDAKGDGAILWHLGYQGDFTLAGGAGTQDWQYAQHDPSFTTANTTGVFGLVLMDNGNDRRFPTGFTCPVALSGNQCLYSRAPIFTIDESAMTATLSHAAITGPYNSYGGNAEQLGNGDIEADYGGTNGGAVIQEVTGGDSPQVVLTIDAPNLVFYRAQRVPSFYPGVTWSTEALHFQVEHATHPADKSN